MKEEGRRLKDEGDGQRNAGEGAGCVEGFFVSFVTLV
jgi:hypothetical protein